MSRSLLSVSRPRNTEPIKDMAHHLFRFDVERASVAASAAFIAHAHERVVVWAVGSNMKQGAATMGRPDEGNPLGWPRVSRAGGARRQQPPHRIFPIDSHEDFRHVDGEQSA